MKEKRETSIRSLASAILGSDAVGVRRFSRLLGKIRSTADALPLARARCRAMAFDFSTVCKKPEDYNNLFSPSEEARKELEHLASFPVGQSTWISPVGLPVKTVDTYASDSSFGWYWKNVLACGQYCSISSNKKVRFSFFLNI